MRFSRAVLFSCAFLLAASGAVRAEDIPYADPAVMKRFDALQQTLDKQQQQIAAQRAEINALKTTLKHKAEPAPAIVAAPAPVQDGALKARVAEQQAAIDALNGKLAALAVPVKPAPADQPLITLANGRPTITSADGRFSFAIRAIGQYDTAYYMQGAAARQLAPANGPDLSSGSNWRRAALGIQGKAFGDWNYMFLYDFGGGAASGNELQGRISAAYMEYAGLAPFYVRIGSFPPSANLEDAANAPDSVFLERNAPADLSRSLTGADGRDAVALIYAGEKLFASFAYTGGKAADTTLYFDEQQGLVGRVGDLFYSNDDWKLLASLSGSYVLRGADVTPSSSSARNTAFQVMPELTTDNNSMRMVSTGPVNVKHAWNAGFEGAAEWRNFYSQAGYFRYGMNPAGGAPDLNFSGWYAQASWILTGERRPYSQANGAFANPKPDKPFSLDTLDPGAWEVAARISNVDLNDNAGVSGAPLPTGGMRGGNQRVYTAEVAWYPNSALKFAVQYQNVDVARLGTIPAGFGHGILNNVDIGQAFNTVAFRAQVAL